MAKGADNYLAPTLFGQLARELAIGHWPLEDILKRYNLNVKTWDRISKDTNFRRLLETEAIAWQSALNTDQRVKLKASAIIEEWLLEANARLHDPDETLSSKVTLAQTIAKFAGIGAREKDEGGGERFSVVINLGGDDNIKIEKEVTPKVIEGVVSNE